jgi:hypothetical protein
MSYGASFYHVPGLCVGRSSARLPHTCGAPGGTNVMTASDRGQRGRLPTMGDRPHDLHKRAS